MRGPAREKVQPISTGEGRINGAAESREGDEPHTSVMRRERLGSRRQRASTGGDMNPVVPDRTWPEIPQQAALRQAVHPESLCGRCVEIAAPWEWCRRWRPLQREAFHPRRWVVYECRGFRAV